MNNEFIVRMSEYDNSVNFTRATPSGMVEARYVRRVDDYFIVYLSSHTGCNLSCRFCHLTATGQTSMEETTLDGYVEQADVVFKYYDRLVKAGVVPAKKVHFNFMARGEPLANSHFIKDSSSIFAELARMAGVRDLDMEFKVSSIIPKTFDADLIDIFEHPKSMLYYSLYSLDPEFRRRWLPKAMDPYNALAHIKDMQIVLKKPIALHWAFINGQNDSRESVDHIATAIRGLGLKTKFNIVRYNPFDNTKSQETSEEEIEDLFKLLEPLTADNERSRIVPRVGFDIKASCGMFINETNN